jgi:dipeptidyl aminopeptidase/acylaminoacyl peptidase
LDTGLVSSPDWSKDGAWIVYTKWEGNHRLYKVRPDGTDRVCLTPNGESYLSPQWSPDGQSILCYRQRNDVYQIYLVDAVSGGETPVTSDYYHNTDASFTPDGQWIVFVKTDQTGFQQVYRIGPNGEGETQLTFCPAQHRDPQVSPTGCWAVYSVWPTDPVSAYYDCSFIEAVNIETGELVTLTDSNATRVNPNWGPHDSIVIYGTGTGTGGNLDRGSRDGICVLKVNLTRQGAGAATGLPNTYVLFQNQPNPFGKGTSIRYGIPKPGTVKLQVCDLAGRVVRVLASRPEKPGYHTVRWDGRDERGRHAASGVYFYELETDGKTMARKMLRLE